MKILLCRNSTATWRITVKILSTCKGEGILCRHTHSLLLLKMSMIRVVLYRYAEEGLYLYRYVYGEVQIQGYIWRSTMERMGPHVPSVKVTQGHWNREGMISYL